MTSSIWAPGDVIDVKFPFADGSKEKSRPALVLSGPSIHGDHTIVMISTKQHDDGVPIAQGDFFSGGLRLDSFVRTRHLYTCGSATFAGKRGTLTVVAMTRIAKALCPGLGCKC